MSDLVVLACVFELIVVLLSSGFKKSMDKRKKEISQFQHGCSLKCGKHKETIALPQMRVKQPNKQINKEGILT